jgi:hypothetical protein
MDLKDLKDLLMRVLVTIIVVILIVTSVWFAGKREGLEKFWDSMGPNLMSSLISFLFGYMIWGWLAKNQNEKDKEAYLKKINELESNLQNLITGSKNELGESILILNKSMQDVEVNSKSLVQLDNVIQGQNSKVRNLIFGMKNSNVFIRNYFTEIMRTYHDQFSIISEGFNIRNEELSLIAYIQFWKYMNTSQIERKRDFQQKITALLLESTTPIAYTSGQIAIKNTQFIPLSSSLSKRNLSNTEALLLGYY